MKEKAQVSRKRVVTVGLVVCAVIVVLSLLTATLDPDQLVKSWFGRGEEAEGAFDFYPIDDYLSARTRDEYAQLDSRVHISDPSTGATYSLEQEDLATAEPYARFFYYYFDTVISGDNEHYATYFSDDYLAAVELPEDFTPQMVYDIRVTSYQADTERGSAYLVDYKILRNNGTFRADVGSNASRTLVIYLVETGGELYINEIIPFTQY
ncbi:MAG: hypothetical protein J6R04_06365 [Clostridia bacterium]|nr:hypothetical protein [Clostridia bacterium]